MRRLGGALVVCALGGCESFGTAESRSDAGSDPPQVSLDASLDASPDALDGSVDEGPGPVFDNATSAATEGASITFNHTVGPGPNRFLLVASHVASSTYATKRVTYGGRELVKLEPTTRLDVEQEDCMSTLFYLVDPPEGTGPVVAYLDSSRPMAVFAMSFHGVSPTAPLGKRNQAMGYSVSGTTATVQLDSASNELIVDSLCLIPATSPNPVTAGPEQTMRVRSEIASKAVLVFGSTSPGGPGRSMTWSFRSAASSLHATALRPAP